MWDRCYGEENKTDNRDGKCREDEMTPCCNPYGKSLYGFPKYCAGEQLGNR